jgi:hypothetical protein
VKKSVEPRCWTARDPSDKVYSCIYPVSIQPFHFMETDSVYETVNQPGMNPPAVPMSFIYQKKWESIKAISIANILRIGKSYIYSSAQSDWADDFTMTARHYSPPHSESRISRQRRRMARYYIGRRVLLKQFLSWQVVKYKSAIEKKEKERWACPFFYKAPVQLADLFFFLSYITIRTVGSGSSKF